MGRGRPTGSKESAATKAAKAAKKRTAQAEAESQRAAKKTNFFAPRTRSSANSAAASSAVSSRSSATASSSSSVLGTDDSDPPAPPLSIAGAGGAGAALVEDTSVPPLPPSALGSLASAVAGGGAGAVPTAAAAAVAASAQLMAHEAQTAVLRQQRAGLLEQAGAVRDAMQVDTDTMPADTPPGPLEVALEPVDVDADPETAEDTPMRAYLRLINKRLVDEMGAKSECTDKWLKKLLDRNDWWLRTEHALHICSKLGIEEPSERFYYYSVYVWLPDVRWGAMPSCPCGCNRENVISHGFRTDTIGRRVTGVDTHYYVIGKRYKCTACEKAAMAEKAASAAASKTYVPGKPHTFMGYDASVLPLYEYSVGDRFPAYLTYNLGVSKEVIRVQGSVGGRHVLPLEQGRQILKIIDPRILLVSRISVRSSSIKN